MSDFDVKTFGSKREAQLNTPAERMRRCRARRVAGMRRVVFNLSADGVALLVHLGWLPEKTRNDAAAVEIAFEKFVNAAAVAGIMPER